jgi:YidC/Oxa1 family membrane protein insertase
LVFKTPEGVEIIKSFTFTQGDYPITVKHQVINRSQQNWQGQMFGQLKRDNSDDPGSLLKVSSLWELILGVHGARQRSIITS